MNLEELLDKKLTSMVATITILIAGLGFMDARHASAADVNSLASVLYEARIEAYEAKIEEAEEVIAEVRVIPDAEQSTHQKQVLIRATSRKGRYLRLIERAELTIESLE